jgi:hypothetical protein
MLFRLRPLAGAALGPSGIQLLRQRLEICNLLFRCLDDLIDAFESALGALELLLVILVLLKIGAVSR